MRRNKINAFIVAIVSVIAVIVMFVSACQKENVQNNKLVEKSSVTLSSFDEFEQEYGDLYDIRQNVVNAITSSIAEKYDGKAEIYSIYCDFLAKLGGDFFCLINVDGQIQVIKYPASIKLDEIKIDIYKSGTYSLKDKEVTYVTYLGENRLDLTNYTFTVKENGDLHVLDINTFKQSVDKIADACETVGYNLNDSAVSDKTEDAQYAMQYFLQSDAVAYFLDTKFSYDETQDKTFYYVVYLTSARVFESVRFEFAGNVIDSDGKLIRDMTDEQFRYYEVKTYGNTVKTVNTAPVEMTDKEYVMQDGIQFTSNQKYIQNGNLPPEQIEINSWEELFNVLGEENQNLIKDKITDILKDNLANSQKLYSQISSGANAKNVEPLKMYITLENNNLFNVKVLCSYKFSENYFSLYFVDFQFVWDINYKNIDAKFYKKFNSESEDQLKIKTETGFIVVDFSMFKYLVTNFSMAYKKEEIDTYADTLEGQNEFFNNLLLPLAEEEGIIANSPTLYKNYTYGLASPNYVITGSFVDFSTYRIKKIKFYLQHNNNSNIEEACQNAVDNGEYEIVLVSEEVITADGIEIDLTDGKYSSCAD